MYLKKHFKCKKLSGVWLCKFIPTLKCIAFMPDHQSCVIVFVYVAINRVQARVFNRISYVCQQSNNNNKNCKNLTICAPDSFNPTSKRITIIICSLYVKRNDCRWWWWWWLFLCMILNQRNGQRGGAKHIYKCQYKVKSSFIMVINDFSFIFMSSQQNQSTHFVLSVFTSVNLNWRNVETHQCES